MLECEQKQSENTVKSYHFTPRFFTDRAFRLAYNFTHNI